MNQKKRFADVVLPFPLYKAYTYSVPDHIQIDIGFRVIVQFGKSRYYAGIVQNIHQNEPKEYQCKDIIEVFDDQAIVPEKQLRLWQWISDYYCCPLGDVMAAALPAYFKLESETKIRLIPDRKNEYTDVDQKEAIILQALKMQEELSIKQIQDILKIKSVFPLIKSLFKKGFVFTREEIREKYKPRMIKCIVLSKNYQAKQDLESLYQKLEKAPKQLDILLSYQLISKNKGIVEKKEVLEKAKSTAAPLNALIGKNIFVETEVRTDRYHPGYYPFEAFELNQAQEQALESIKKGFEKKDVCLLHGITSSGKTHIYIKLIEEYIEKGKQVLYLVPEIALTAQLIKKLISSFGDKIGIFHSRFNQSERYEIWQKLLQGEIDIILGVRSAVFLPFSKLGLIIIDEEHENTYKQRDPSPRYHARDSAIYSAFLYGAKTLLGSATPSLESYHNAQSGKYHYVKLRKRYSEVLEPEIEIIDLRLSHKKKQMLGSISRTLLNEIQTRINKKEQVILFQNRRGYAPHLVCKTCGWSPICKHCDIKLTYHKYTRRLRCHYCGFSIAMIDKCQACGSKEIEMRGFGTERIEDELEEIIGNKDILRMDSDTTRNKNAHQKIITQFEKGKSSILIGTQMITKGLDFENVKLVGIINADLLLSFPDFRSEERTFQLINQVGGRAGRRNERGRVMVQTYSPDHHVFQLLEKRDEIGFYEYELKNRDKYAYPPFVRLIEIMIKSKDAAQLDKVSNALAKSLKKRYGERIYGPEFPPAVKLKDYFQKHILCKFEKNNRKISEAKKFIQDEISGMSIDAKGNSLRIIVDVDPY